MRPTNAQTCDEHWLRQVFLAVLAVTAGRILVLWGSPTDLYVDESQYWLWGQHLDFGYFSKPPMIGWVLRVFDELVAERSAFTVRVAAPLFHGLTALLLAIFARQLAPEHRFAPLWVAMVYLSMPVIAVGSFLISTDTIMAPFLVGALILYWRICAGAGAGSALLGGILLGCAFLSKYAALYFVPGALLAYVLHPAMRPNARHLLLFASAFLLTAAPNILWNISHDLTTVSHTMDNIGWVKGESSGPNLNFAGLAEFAASQFGVMGPVFMALWLIALFAAAPSRRRALLWISIPVWTIVLTQALLSRAYANWAFAAVPPATIVAVLWALERKKPRVLWIGITINVALSLLIAFLVTFPLVVGDGKGQPLAKRYVNVANITHEAVALARANDIDTVLGSSRNMMADFLFTGADSGLTFYTPQRKGTPHSYYEQKFALPEAHSGKVLYIAGGPLTCADGSTPAPIADLQQDIGAWAAHPLPAYIVEPACLP